jgi:hypothetical protein
MHCVNMCQHVSTYAAGTLLQAPVAQAAASLALARVGEERES